MGGNLLLSSTHQAWVSCPITGPPAPRPNHFQSKQGRQHAWPAHQVLVRRIVRGFPLDDSRGFAHTDHVQVTGRKPAIRDHPHHDIVRGWPLVRHHHPDLKQTPREFTQWSANHFFPQQHSDTRTRLKFKAYKKMQDKPPPTPDLSSISHRQS